MSTARATPANDVPSIGWLLGMSSWMLLTLVPGPLFAWLGFGIIGVVSRSRRLIIIGVVWAAVAILVNLELWGQAQPIVRAVAYLAGMVCALAVNPGWLRTMWQRRLDKSGMGVTSARAAATGTAAGGAAASGGNRASRRAAARRKRAAQQQAKAATLSKASAAETAPKPASDAAAELASEVGASADDLLEPRASAVTSAAPAAPDAPAEPVDVNTATAKELEGLPGVSRARARKAVAERDEQGGFSSLEDFGETLGLQPHEIVRLRKVAVCSPRPRGERRFGRRVDF
ncbi:ComEA family DNA-binding protein [Microbacterium kyungheense]|uniref:DNA uptake protein ComE-like DNA-binding protein n=1 Tax=Microbacterium kyungheense TaxID=1263636 RepID=A0A543ESB2_9MICO|nr:helix-hairpin-helix domain-containing protein [Microbacterium kyungheense]TQM24484.1 DNA uptake protein ComE-like DNA-binding protein [Microbacterium kyungheense]